MKALYILDTTIKSNSGVVKKVIECMLTWSSNGITSYILEYPTGAIFDASLKLINEPIIKPEEARSRIGWFAVFNRRALGLNNAILKLSPDIIYLREIIWTPKFNKYTKKSKYIVEVNSIAASEIKKRSMVAALYWRLNQYMLLKRSAGVVCVTNEIFKSLIYKPKFSALIPNGIELRYFSDDDAGFSNKISKPSVLFVGSPRQEWHGVKKIIRYANNHKEFEFNIVGIDGNNSENIKYHGYRDAKYIDELCRSSHVGVSTLSLHYKNMSEACPLKSRYYLERGLPLIMGYIDPDIKQNHDFICNIGNYDDNVSDNDETITNYIWKCYHDRDLKVRAREFAENVLSIDVKEKSRLEFINKVLNEA